MSLDYVSKSAICWVPRCLHHMSINHFEDFRSGRCLYIIYVCASSCLQFARLRHTLPEHCYFSRQIRPKDSTHQGSSNKSAIPAIQGPAHRGCKLPDSSVMVDHIVLKPLGLVLIVTAQMVFNGKLSCCFTLEVSHFYCPLQLILSVAIIFPVSLSLRFWWLLKSAQIFVSQYVFFRGFLFNVFWNWGNRFNKCQVHFLVKLLCVITLD